MCLESCTFGVVSGIKTAHTSDIGAFTTFQQIFMRNCLLASPTEVATWSASDLLKESFVVSQKHDQTVGNHKFWLQYGVGSIDTTWFKTASPSLRLTPNTFSPSKMESAVPDPYGDGTFTVAVASGSTVTVSVATRKSRAGDTGGTTYSGSHERLIVRKNLAAGITTDTVLATATTTTDASIANPEAFNGTGWNGVRTTVASSAVTAPDNISTAIKVTEQDLSAGTHYVQTITPLACLTASTIFSVYVHAGVSGRNFALQTSAGKGRGFDLSSGTTNTVSGITDASSYGISGPDAFGFYRCWIQCDATISSVTLNMIHAVNGLSYTGSGAAYIYLWGAMFNTGASPGTYIPLSQALSSYWDILSGTTAAVTDDAILEFIVDCDGTAGWVNVDDWTSTPLLDSKGNKYWVDGTPYIVGDNQVSGGISRSRQLLG